MIALLVGTLLALAAMAYVLAPLFLDASVAPSVATVAREERVGDEQERGERAVDALREIEFDRATGKLSDADYAALKTRYTEQALSAMRAQSATASPISDADLEAVIRRQRAATAARSCPTHGIRPEADALYCSECGRYLPGVCAKCGAHPSAPGARFCDSCGHRLAA